MVLQLSMFEEFFEKLLMFNISFPSNRGERTSYSKHSERSFFFQLHRRGSFPSDEDGYPFQPAATSAIGICSVCLENWIFSCMDHDRSTAWNIQRNLGWNVKQVLIEGHLKFENSFQLTCVEHWHSTIQFKMTTNPRSCFIFTFIFMDDNPSTFMSFFLGGEGLNDCHPDRYLYLWVNK